MLMQVPDFKGGGVITRSIRPKAENFEKFRPKAGIFVYEKSREIACSDVGAAGFYEILLTGRLYL